MLERALLRTTLLLWLAQLTLQGGTGYGPGAQNANGYQPNTKAQGYGPAAPQANGNGAKGYGAAQATGNNGKPSGPYKGYSAVPASLGNGNGAKPNGFGAFAGATKGNGGGYGSKPNKPGYGAQPAYGGFGAGMRVAPQMANKGRGGYGKGNGFGYAGSSFAGYRNRPAAYPQAGQAGGYPNGAKATKPGYGGRPLTPSGQAAKPNGYGDTRGPKAGYGGYPNGGGFKGPKPGYGGLPTGYGQRPNGYGGYPNGGAKAPKPGYGPVTDSSEKRPKEQSLGPEAPNVQSVTGYIKGVVQPAEPEPTVGVPTALPPTKGMPSFVTGWKRPKPQVPVFPQGYPSKPIVQEQSPMIPQNKASKPVQYIPQEQAPIPELAPLIPQAKPVVPALLPFAEQGKGPKPYTQVLQSAAPVYPQGNGPNPVTLQPAVPQNKGPKPAASVLLPVFLQTKGPKPVSPIPEIPQTKDTKPVAPEPAAPQTAGSVLSLEPTPAMPQMKGPKLANPDCGLGVSGQWTKLPSPGYGPGPWYPNNGGAKASKPGLGFGPKAKQPGYGNPGAGYGYGNGAGASLGEVMKGKTEYESEPCFEAGTNPIEPQTAELGPGVKSGHAYGGPYGAQPAGFGSEGKPQVRYGIGGLLFGGSPMGYSPYENYGNPFVAQPYGSKAAGNYNPPEFNTNPKSAAKYMMGGSPYSASPSDPKASGKYGPYGGQQHGFPAVAGNSGKYGNPSLPFEALGPVTDGQLVEQPALQYEAPAIDGVKSVDQFGEGEVQPQPIAPLVDRAGQAVSLPAAPTDGPFTGSATSLGNSPVDTPTEVETPQHNLAQQKHKGPQLPQAWTGGNEQKHNLKGFFGNGYHGKTGLCFNG
ncbi:calymmin isoform X11 [Tachysurus ichikawai]